MSRLLDPQKGEVCSVVIDDDPGSWGVNGETGPSVFINGILTEIAGARPKGNVETGWCQRVYPRGSGSNGNKRPPYMTGVIHTDDVVRLYADDKTAFLTRLPADVFWLDIRHDDIPHHDAGKFLDDLVNAFPSSCFVIISRYVASNGDCKATDPDILSFFNRDFFLCTNTKNGSACKFSWNGRHVLSMERKMGDISRQRPGAIPDRLTFLPDQMCEILSEVEVIAPFRPGCVHVLPRALDHRDQPGRVVDEAKDVWGYLRHTWAEQSATVVPGKNKPPTGRSVAFARNGRFIELQNGPTEALVILGRHLLQKGLSSLESSAIHDWKALTMRLAGKVVNIAKAGLKRWPTHIKDELFPLSSLVPPCGRRATRCCEPHSDRVEFMGDFPDIVLHIPPRSSHFLSTDKSSLMTLASD